MIPKRQNALTTLQNRQASGQTLGANQQARLTKLDNRFNSTPAATQPAIPTTGGGVQAGNKPPVVGTQTGSGFKLGTTIEELNAQKAGLKGATRIGMVDNAISKLNTPAAATPAPVQPANDIVTNGMGNETATRSMPVQGSTFKTTQDFMPSDLSADPVYKAAEDRGNTRINRLLAKRGLLKSGAEVEAQNDLTRDLEADFYGRNLGVAQNDANRFDNQSQFASNFSANREDAQWDRFFRNNDQMLGQSPMKEAYDATGQVAGLEGKAGQALVNYLKDAYQRVRAPAGGGGGGSMAPFQPPSPSGPDYSNIDIIAALGGGAGNQGYANAITSFLPYLSKLNF